MKAYVLVNFTDFRRSLRILKALDKVGVIYPFNAGIKSLRAALPGEIFLLGILLLEPCISLIYA
jgi:hypothetical protein